MSCRGLGDGPSDVCVSRLLFYRIKKRGTQHVFYESGGRREFTVWCAAERKKKNWTKGSIPMSNRSNLTPLVSKVNGKSEMQICKTEQNYIKYPMKLSYKISPC